MRTDRFFPITAQNFQATGYSAHKIHVIGYLRWDDKHSGSADVGSVINVDSFHAHTRARGVILSARARRRFFRSGDPPRSGSQTLADRSSTSFLPLIGGARLRLP